MGPDRFICSGGSRIQGAPEGTAETTSERAAGRADRRVKSPTVASRRAEALRAFFPKLSVWLNNRIHFARMREVESYLSEATDLADLERRIAQIERSARRH